MAEQGGGGMEETSGKFNKGERGGGAIVGAEMGKRGGD